MKNDIESQTASNLLMALDDEIDKKCFELIERKKINFLRKLFILGCTVTIVFPILSFVLGFSLISTLIPVFIFQAVSLIILLPVLINAKGEATHNEKV